MKKLLSILILALLTIIPSHAQNKFIDDVSKYDAPELIKKYLTGSWEASFGAIIKFSPWDTRSGVLTKEGIGSYVDLEGRIHENSLTYILSLQTFGGTEVWFLEVGDEPDKAVYIKKLTKTTLILVGGDALDGTYTKISTQKKKK